MINSFVSEIARLTSGLEAERLNKVQQLTKAESQEAILSKIISCLKLGSVRMAELLFNLNVVRIPVDVSKGTFEVYLNELSSNIHCMEAHMRCMASKSDQKE